MLKYKVVKLSFDYGFDEFSSIIILKYKIWMIKIELK